MCEVFKTLQGGGVLTCDTPGISHDLHYDTVDDVSWREGPPDD
jgi:hypothetical protein